MSSWVQYEPGQDVLGKTVQVVTAEGRIRVQGTSSDPEPSPAPSFAAAAGYVAGIALVPDPDAEGLDADARELARGALAARMQHIGLPVGQMFGLRDGDTLRVRA